MGKILLKFLLSVSLLIPCSSAFAQFPNVRVSSSGATTPEEVSIAINPVNPLNLIGGANINYYYFSTDGGHTWNEKRLSSTLGVWGDPSVIFDPLGNAYFGHLSNPAVDGYWIDRIIVQKSTDGGSTYNNGVGIGYFAPKEQDKEWLIADHSNSQYRNNLYVAWTEFDEYGSRMPTDSSRILFSRSTDHGDSWSNPVVVSDRCGNCVDSDSTVEGAVPAVGPDGEVYLSWAGPLCIMFDRSTDAGKTWGKDIFVSSQPGGWDFNVPQISRCNGLPVTVCDISNSPYKGTIYINWSDQRNGTTNTDIFISKSTDGGNTWSNPVKVNDDSSKHHQFFTWACVDPVTGILYVVFYDRRNSTGYSTEVYMARSSDGGETFTNFKVSASPFIPVKSVFFGDYISIAAYDGKVYPLWQRMDSRRLSIWTALIDDTMLPVKMSSFSASRSGDLVNLQWTTSSEQNNKAFIVERKSAGSGYSAFEPIVTINAKAAGNGFSGYSYTDNISAVSGSKIFYRLKQMDFNGSFTYSEEKLININPAFFSLEQNHPNPFNPATTIKYNLPKEEYVTIKVYDALGKEIITLIDRKQSQGRYSLVFNGEKLSSGLYIYRISAGSFSGSRKMLLLK